MFYLTIIDVLNWTNTFLLSIIFGFLIYWYLRIWKKKETIQISKIFLIINYLISGICLFLLVWSWVTFYLLEDIYHLNIEKIQALVLDISFCLVSVVLNIFFVVYLLVSNINFWLVQENQKTLILGFWKIELNNLSIKNETIYFKEKKILRLFDSQIKKQIQKIK